MLLFNSVTVVLVQILFLLPDSHGTTNNETSNSSNAMEESDLEYLQNQYDNLFAPDSDSDADTFLKSGINFNLPDMSEINNACGKTEFFASFNPLHMKAVNLVKQMLSGPTTLAEWFKMAIALRKSPDINPKVWYYAVTSSMYNSGKMKGIRKNPPWVATPDDYFVSAAIELARCVINKPSSSCSRKCVRYDETFSADNGIESALWYFREDIFMNAQHWYYHLAYPHGSLVRADRTGELFYFFHEQLVARYNAERFSNGFPRVRAFDFRIGGNMEEGYHAHMRDDNSGYNWTDRAPNTLFVDTRISSPTNHSFSISIANLTKSNSRISRAIADGFIVAKNGTQVKLSSFNGIDLLGDIIQAKNFSLNPDFYGLGPDGLHNLVHDVIGYSSDPQSKRMIPPGVMSTDNTAARDPIFYRWHQYINDLFDQHKKKLKPYAPSGGDFPLLWNGVSLDSLKVISKKPGSSSPIVENQLFTFWKMRKLYLNRGLDYVRYGLVPMCVKHLDHSSFKYEIIITKKSSVKSNRAMIRVFLAPRYKESGERFTVEDQRNFFISLDSFPVSLKTGKNVIRRNSMESTVTIQFDQSYGHIQAIPNEKAPNCGCGWPYHLLIPKGNEMGMTVDLFVMVTDGNQDLLPVTDSDSNGFKFDFGCRESPVYCGLINKKYPDAKPMGYPFDRLPRSGGESTLDEFMKGIPNMRSTQVRIFHTTK